VLLPCALLFLLFTSSFSFQRNGCRGETCRRRPKKARHEDRIPKPLRGHKRRGEKIYEPFLALDE
jgi:hypothetical protein